MADNVPVSDVLCEAMEYLAKLGSNLRTRSDVLMDKKIRRDKLKNSHAVTKAAKKVLQICELSKKSLENVEIGVKRILNAVDASQRRVASVGGKSTPRGSLDSDKLSPVSKKEVHYIVYKAQKLRMEKKISLKHYRSVKVLAENMSMSSQDKYPVYLNCKLYRLRKKLANKVTVHNLGEHINTDDFKKNKEIGLDSSSSKNKTQSEEDAVSRGRSQDRIETKAGKKYFEPEKDGMKVEELLKDCNFEKESSDKKHSESKKDSDSENEDAIEREQRRLQKTKNREVLSKEDEIERDQKKHQKTKDRDTSKHKDNQGNRKEDSLWKKGKNVSFVNLSSDEEDIITSPRSKKKVILSDSDESNNKESVQKSDLKSTSDVEKQDIDSDCIKTPQTSTSVDTNCSPEVKPVLKLVSLSKLLKPDVLVKVAGQTIKAIRSKQQKDSSQSLIKKIDLCDNNDEEFWATKRKEVKGFKAKEFRINVVKLPTNFTAEFLNKFDLKKILQNDSILFELESTSFDDTDIAGNPDVPGVTTCKNIKDSVDPPAMDAIKQALLNDSDSEKSVDSPANGLVKECENAKKTLLDDSDTDNEAEPFEVSKETHVQSKQKESSDESDSDKDQENGQNKDTMLHTNDREKTPEIKSCAKPNVTDIDLAKSSLLENSAPTTPQTPVEETRRKSLSVTPSKKKQKMDSMHAKKLLLSRLSSSDEDDKMTQIRSELLKDSSDEEASPKVIARKRLLSSDSEIDDVLKRAKKKKKLRCSKNSRSDENKSSNGSADEQNCDGDKKLNGSSDQEQNCGSGTEKDNQKHNDQQVPSSDDEKKDSHNKKDIKKELDVKASSDQDDAMDLQSSSSEHKMGRTREIQGSSSNSEGQDDKEIDGLTNMKSLTRSSRRRGSPKSEDSHSKIKIKLNETKSFFAGAGDGLLEASLSSDNASISGEEEELPPVSMVDLNGSGGVNHLAKNDLLGSDSNGEDEESKEDDNNDNASDNDKKDDSDFSDTVKARRRKGHTISSDSEAGTTRVKSNVRGSDFDDSDVDSELNKAKKKRNKKSSDEESTGSGSASERKKKRRRIKSVNDSDASGSDSENEGKKHGRKNIRKVMGKNQLEEATKKAAREEKERMARIAERQKTYNNLQFDETGKPDEVVLDKVVLDFDPDTKEPLIQVDPGLVKKLKPHQANGIKFMWDACFESVKRIKKDRGSGCILAHCMGLGKTLQVVSLTHTLMTHTALTGVQRVLVVCPLSTVLNWVNEYRMWLEFAENEPDVDVYELSRHKQNSERAYQLSHWFKHGGVCVLGYEMFRNLSADNPKKFKKKMLKQFQESLVDPGPDMVVCDEGHLLKNEKTSLSQSMNRVRTRRRIVLTGTPLQNNLKEYYCMVQFVKPNLLGKYNEYLNRFVNPITNGQYTDSTEHDIKIMKRRSHVLHKMLDGAVQRRDYGVLAPFLPPKHEYVLFITLTEVQIKLYQHYLENYSRRPFAGKTSGFLFPDFQSLQRIWTHPLVLKYNSERYEIMQQKKRDKEEEDSEGSLVDFIDDDSTPDETSTEESSDDLSDVSDDSRKKSKKKKGGKKGKGKDSRANNRRTTRANPELEDDDVKLPELPLEVKNDNPTEWWMPLVTDDELEDLRHSHKLVLLFEILRQCEAIGDKLLVFSQSLYSLDLIEHFLGKVDEATQDGRRDEKLGGHVGSWSPGIDYFRLDGSTSCENRSIWCKNFNREDNPRARLFLISTRAGGLGINLVAANRVVIFDVSWNPSHDVQSIFRVYRFGQKKPCYVYRFLAMGTMEEKIYERQVTKQAISKRVIDEQQIDRHYKENDLAELYTFEPRPPAPRPVPLVPKDRFFAEMLKDHEALIYKFHEHDSLLENKEEETLSEEERKAAWDDFENEKNRPPPQPFTNWPMHNGMMPNLLAAQQQQMAYAALGAVLRKDMPGLSDEQIRGMIPLIYGANPAMFGGYDYSLMQKLNDMYKYAQPGMVNPAMMNPGVMGAGGASMSAGGAGSASSGLQYEPPWQRQQQQQQQVRLQQLMQQQALSGGQQPMGAKLYAGGLGSRDPVAMALQQQRAREIMLGERRGRGRPPMAHSGDVVNLDSD